MRCGAAVSLIGQTGQSDDIHSPDEWARLVVRRISPTSLSIAVLCMVAISCWPSTLRTMSSPLDNGAYRKVRSPSRGNGDRIVAVSDFSGLVISACALASAAARAPIDSLERCMAALHLEQIEADGAGFGALGSNPVADRLLGVFGHQPLEFGLGPLMLEEGGAGRAE